MKNLVRTQTNVKMQLAIVKNPWQALVFGQFALGPLFGLPSAQRVSWLCRSSTKNSNRESQLLQTTGHITALKTCISTDIGDT